MRIFVDGALYRDRYGDTWRAIWGGAELEHVSRADGTDTGHDGLRWHEPAETAERSFGPMTFIEPPQDPIPYWGPRAWTGPVAHCPGMRHRAPLTEDGVMARHSISEGFTGRCPGVGKPPRATPWEPKPAQPAR